MRAGLPLIAATSSRHAVLHPERKCNASLPRQAHCVTLRSVFTLSKSRWVCSAAPAQQMCRRTLCDLTRKTCREAHEKHKLQVARYLLMHLLGVMHSQPQLCSMHRHARCTCRCIVPGPACWGHLVPEELCQAQPRRQRGLKPAVGVDLRWHLGQQKAGGALQVADCGCLGWGGW